MLFLKFHKILMNSYRVSGRWIRLALKCSDGSVSFSGKEALVVSDSGETVRVVERYDDIV